QVVDPGKGAAVEVGDGGIAGGGGPAQAFGGRGAVGTGPQFGVGDGGEELGGLGGRTGIGVGASGPRCAADAVQHHIDLAGVVGQRAVLVRLVVVADPVPARR